MHPKLHAAAGGLALGLIALFWLATLWAETLGGAAAIAPVKRNILFGLALLVPAVALAGAGGFRLARTRRGPTVERKARRMRLIAGNGLLILVPSAIFLDQRAAAGQIDAAFYAVQLLELAVGAVNITLLARNMRDGLALRRPVGAGG
ncbi:hypothetical protein Ga0609869_000345 [Rhodovulum iodosum]|uniref:Transmembrane protein n=1 Tax=Rhodovulum iodosum TaxID=68291 RepID=A0ABV3XNW2_9RHOB|nr:hypothetical protein [Rhodovulum robiginosum]RSK37935.1 hypothetical protein EJA01_03140 [Rhodovulum robiginosum]